MAEDIREFVKNKYAQTIKNRTGRCGENPSGCCSGDPLSGADKIICGDLYNSKEVEGLPTDLVAASFGCGNPTALADLKSGEIVDLGSGAGLDVLLSARRVGPLGKAYGLI